MKNIVEIKPVPQIVSWGKGSVKLGTLGKADFSISAENLNGDLSKKAFSDLDKFLSGKLCDIGEKKGSVKIALSLSADVPEEVKINADQAYKIEAKNDEILLIGYGEAGVYYAVNTFMQCVKIQDNIVFVPEMSLLDWPDLRTRGHFMECRYGSNLMELEDWKALVDDMAAMKMNQLVVALYGCWNVQYDGIISEYVYIPVKKYPDIRANVVKRYFSPKENKWIDETVPTPMAEKDFFGELVAYGKSCGVEVLPLWNSYGHNTLIPRLYPEVSAVIDGKRTGHGFCISTKKTYDILFDIFDQIIDDYLKPNGIESFHIGLDEVWEERATDVNDVFKVFSPWCECDECKKMSNEEKFLTHAIRLIKHLKGRGMKNVYIYSDMMTRVVDPIKFKKILEDNDLLDVTVADWWTYTNYEDGLMFKTMYPELGIRSTIKPWNSYYHWNSTFDSVPNVYILSEMAHREGHVEGIQSYSAWDKSCDKNHMSMADYSWNFIGTGSVSQFRDRYAMREFGARYDEAKLGLELMDEITERRPGNSEFERTGEEETVGNGTIIHLELSYYFFSYVRPDKDYPRNFPGEGMTNILSKRAFYEKRLSEISEKSVKALSIFDELAKDPRCNVELAKRFACECANYLALAEDYKALLKIHDAAEAKDAKTVAALASERKNARLSLMLKIESVKEAFLMPSHLRNQSIFMQLFADIEAYANKASDMKIDVRDLRNLASDAFMSLR